jgi:hypothetical protein
MDYDPVDTPLDTLNSTYEITYEGIWLGARGRKQTGRNTELFGSLAISPYLQAKAAGNWNLRPMTFEERGTGQGAEGNIAMTYRPNHKVDLTLGYRYRWLMQQNGVDLTYYEGNTYSADWDEAVSIQQGMYGRLNYRF